MHRADVQTKQLAAFRPDDLTLFQMANDKLGVDCQQPVEVHAHSAAGAVR